MAIYHLEGKIISRSQGRSSVAAAAYRSGTCFVDERTDLTHDFTEKAHDILHAEILLPEGSPEWMKEREMLWNHVEQIERRKDAQLAREFTIALPREFTLEQNLALAKEFVQREFVDRGMVADMCLHRGHSNGEEQPHIHVMLGLREVTEKGFGKKVREWNDKTLMLHWREVWAEQCNHHLALNGFDLRIDHRTLEAQGINLEPQSKIGPKKAKERMARLKEHQRIAQRNGQRILKDPNTALTALTHQQSTFTHQDLARFVNRHTATPEQFTKVYEVLKNSRELVQLGKDDRGRDRLTTKTMLKLEKTLINQVQGSAKRSHHTVTNAHKTLALTTRKLSDEQKIAFSHLLDSGDVAAVVGFAGTGKSYMLGSAKKAWEKAGYTVQGMTLSGIAAENLEGGSGIRSHTIANRLINWENDRQRLTKRDVVVIDEAGMVGSRQMAAIFAEATKAGAKVVLVGDPEQLQAIEAGAAFRAILERIGFVEMTEVRRQKIAWQQDATKQLALQHTGQALSTYHSHNLVHEFETKARAMNAVIETWQETRSNEPNKSQIILAYTRKDVQALNEQARAARKENGELKQDHSIETHQGKRDVAVGDRVYFLRNEKSLNVKNGTLGTLEAINGKQLTVRLDAQDKAKPKVIQFHLSDYNHLDHGYAATVYKSQGVTVDRSYVLASNYFDRHTSYVALSRHREGAELFWDREEFKNFHHMAQALGRDRSKDFTQDYANQRGFTRPATQKIQSHEKQFLFEETHTRVDLKTPSAKSLERPSGDLQKIMMDAAKRIVELDKEITELKQGTSAGLVDQYKQLVAKRYQTQDAAQHTHYEKELNQLAVSIYKNTPQLAKIKASEPRIGKLIKARAQKVLERGQDQGIER